MKLIKNLELKTKNHELGFTLIEMVIVIGLISIFLAGVIAVLNPVEQIKKGNDTKRKAHLSQIQRGLENYYNDFGRYPEAVLPDYKIKSHITPGAVDWGTSWSPYMDILPKDPSGSQYYIYVDPSSTGQSYGLYASLERGGKDPQACNSPSDNTCANAPSGINCGTSGQNCNFGVSSPNVSP